MRRLALATLAALAVMTGLAQGAPLPLYQLTSGMEGATCLAPFGDVLVFRRADALWRSDGTPMGTKLVKRIGFIDCMGHPFPPDELDDDGIVLHDGKLFFVADDGTSGAEVWVSDGTPDGTHLVADIDPGPGSSRPRSLVSGRDAVYFAADDKVAGGELWRTDGTAAGTWQVADVLPGWRSSKPGRLRRAGDLVYFNADDGVTGRELWRSDGTAAGTVQVADIHPGPSSSDPSWLIAFQRRLYFSADDGTHGFELWRTSRSGRSAALFLDAAADGDGAPEELVATRDALLAFVSPEGAENGADNELIRIDRATSAVTWIGENTVRRNGAGWHVGAGNTAYFVRGKYPTSWSAFADGALRTATATFDPSERRLNAIAPLGDRLVLRVPSASSVGDPWITDGTQAGSYPLAVFTGTPRRSVVGDAVAHLGLLFVSSEQDLWAIPAHVLCQSGVCGVEEGRCWGARPGGSLHTRWGFTGNAHQLRLTGEVPLDGSDLARLEPSSGGVRLTVTDASGERLLDVLVPGGTRPGPTTPGWTSNRDGTRWRFVDRDGQGRGIREIVLQVHAAVDGPRLRFRLRGHGAALRRPATGPLTVLIDLDGAPTISNLCAAGVVEP